MPEESAASRRQKLVDRISELRDKAADKGVHTDNIREILLNQSTKSTKSTQTPKEGSEIKRPKSLVKISIVFLCVGIICAVCGYWLEFFDWYDLRNLYLNTFILPPCLVDNNGVIIEVARPPVKCEFCRNLTHVPIEHNISREEFLRKYAYTSVPVLVKNATTNWLAMSTFSFQHFKGLYEDTEDGLQTLDQECQFFPYKTEFNAMSDVFNMSEDRANFVEGEKPWYIGW